MTTTSALITAGGVLLAASISGLGGVALGAWLTSRAQRQNLEIARAHQLEDRAAADLRVARDDSAEAYGQAREGVGWLHSVRVEDCVTEPWKSIWADDLRDSLERITTARRTLDRTSTILGDVPLGEAARDTAHQLLLLQNAWADALHHAEGMHGKSGQKWHEHQWTQAQARIDTARQLLTGFAGPLHEEKEALGPTEASLLNQLRTEISKADRKK